MYEWLKDLRLENSQESIAKKVGISQQHYSLIEKGEREPSVAVAKRIAAVLGFDWTKFYEEGA